MTEQQQVLSTQKAKEKGVNLTFSSSSEIESYVRGKLGQPGQSAGSGDWNQLTR